MRWALAAVAYLFAALPAPNAAAASASDLQRDSARTLERLYDAQPAARAVLSRAAGVLVFPGIYKGGIGLGAEFGEGVLREGGGVSGYYRVVTGSIGFQLGVQKRAQVIAFMDPSALRRFKNSDGWEVGIDGSIVVADLGTGAQADSKAISQPIIAFILDEKGLMYNVTLEGSKISRIRK